MSQSAIRLVLLRESHHHLAVNRISQTTLRALSSPSSDARPKLEVNCDGEPLTVASSMLNENELRADSLQQHEALLPETSSSSLLPPLNGLEPQMLASNFKHDNRRANVFSWKNTSYQCLNDDNSMIPQHVVMECLQWWTRQRPIRRDSTSMTWKLMEVLVMKAKSKETTETVSDAPPAAGLLPKHRALLNSVLDHWRLAIQDRVPVPMTVQEALVKVQEWNDTIHIVQDDSSAADVSDAVQKTYSILLKALSVTQESLELVDEILQSMPVAPSTVTTNAALTVYAKSKQPQSAYERARLLIESMKQPNEISYACLLEALLHDKGSNHNAVQKADAIIQEMKARGVSPNSICYLHYLRILTSSNQLDRALETLHELVADYKRSWKDCDQEEDDNDSHVVVIPTRHLFSAIMSAYARRGDFDRVKELLQELQSLYAATPRREDKDLLMPTSATMNSVLEAYAKKRTLDGAHEAVAVLERLEDWAAQQNVAACLPNTMSYNTVLDAWAEVSRFYPDAVFKAEALLERMMNHGHAKPDSYSFTTVMKAWSRSDRREAPERCQAYLDAMWGIYEQERRSNAKPSHVTYATAIYALSRVANKRNDAPYRAEALYRDMKQRGENGDSSLQPTEAIYVSLMTTWNRSITPQNKGQALTRSQFYFDQMRALYMAGDDTMRPTAKLYNALLEGMKQAGDGKGAERVYKRMMDDYERHGNDQAKPNSYTFQSIMTAWARSKSPFAPLRAEALLKQMEDFHERLGWDCRPTAVGFSTVLNCWATSGRDEAPERAETILRHMEKLHLEGRKDVQPNTYAYATVLDSWARSRLEHAPERATLLFNELQERYEAGEASCRPSAAAYMALMSSWGRSRRQDGALKALAVLNEMGDRYQIDSSNERAECLHFSAVINAFAERGDEENARALLLRIVNSEPISPNAACYNGYIKAIIRSGGDEVGEKAEAVLRSMQNAGSVVRPDVVTYTSCISAWRRSQANYALDRAESLMRECVSQAGNKSAGPNASTFLAFLCVLSNGSSTNKSLLARWVVEQMSSLGMPLTPAILNELDKCKDRDRKS